MQGHLSDILGQNISVEVDTFGSREKSEESKSDNSELN